MQERSINQLSSIHAQTRDQRLDQDCMHPNWGVYTPIPGLGIEPATQVCALIRNQTCNLLVTGQHSNQLSHISQGSLLVIITAGEQKAGFIWTMLFPLKLNKVDQNKKLDVFISLKKYLSSFSCLRLVFKSEMSADFYQIFIVIIIFFLIESFYMLQCVKSFFNIKAFLHLQYEPYMIMEESFNVLKN